MSLRDKKVVAELEHQLMMGKANRLAWQEKAAFMRDAGATHATWGENDELLSLTLAPQQPRPAVQQPAPGPAAKLADAFANRMKREHEVRFAASHFKPRLDVPETENQVPRAVLAKSQPNGRATPKHPHR